MQYTCMNIQDYGCIIYDTILHLQFSEKMEVYKDFE